MPDLLHRASENRRKVDGGPPAAPIPTFTTKDIVDMVKEGVDYQPTHDGDDDDDDDVEVEEEYEGCDSAAMELLGRRFTGDETVAHLSSCLGETGTMESDVEEEVDENGADPKDVHDSDVKTDNEMCLRNGGIGMEEAVKTSSMTSSAEPQPKRVKKEGSLEVKTEPNFDTGASLTRMDSRSTTTSTISPRSSSSSSSSSGANPGLVSLATIKVIILTKSL